MPETLSRRQPRHTRRYAVYAFDSHGDLIFNEVDDEQGANARPNSLEQLSERRQLALSWGSR